MTTPDVQPHITWHQALSGYYSLGLSEPDVIGHVTVRYAIFLFPTSDRFSVRRTI